jgi:menaquinol-cytochrome c reductase iron-sulfur subunit
MKTGSEPTRRSVFSKLGIGAVLAGLGAQLWAFLRSLAPNVLYEEPQRFKAGLPEQFPDGATFLEERRVFIFREQRTFYAISASCTHLGCTVKMLQQQGRREFHCPCHGSKYRGDGTQFAGPAPAALAWYRLEIAAEDGQLVVNLADPVGRNFRLTV